jgi:release factor glutamine methyltransferase
LTLCLCIAILIFMTEDELILTHILNCSLSELHFHNLQLNDRQKELFELYKQRRKNGEPLQYILGSCSFMGFEIKVDPRVLVPRPETEMLVEEAVKKLKAYEKTKILDLGTGSGNIPIALAKLMPSCRITTIEVSKKALELAKENAIKNEVDGQIDFIHDDMLEFLKVGAQHAVPLQYDLIISNPPYIPDEQMDSLPADVKREPELALKAGKDGLKFYRDIIKYSPCLIRVGGYLMMEFGDGQSLAIQTLMEEYPALSYIKIFPDLTGRDRFICAEKN